MSTEKNTKAKKAKPTEVVTPEVESKPIVPKDVDLNQMIVVRSGFHGRLVFVSPRTKEKFIWSEFGDEQVMELLEIRNAKNTSKKFFINNWFVFDDEYAWVVDYLGLGQYYKNALDLTNFDEVFSKSPAEIEKRIAKLSSGQRKSVAYRARQLIADGEIDSNKAISALEKSLGVELIEH